MSALPLIETQTTLKPIRHRNGLFVSHGAKHRRMSKSRAKAIEHAFERAVMFCTVAVATFMVSSLVGHVMVEKSRRDGQAALSRMRLAKKSESMLAEQVYALTNVETVQAWAQEHGYRLSPEAVKPKPENTLVALR